MDCADAPVRVLILGVHIRSEGYPNTLYKLEDLEASGRFSITEINAPMRRPDERRPDGLIGLLGSVWRVLTAHASILIRYLAGPRPKRVYVPYPSVFVLFLLSLLPRRLRPHHVVADAFISLHDTIVADRRMLSERGIPARLLKCIERRAYRLADKVVVDTRQNACFISEKFGLSESKVVDIPLSTNERIFRSVPYRPTHRTCRVLFVGTLIPLHGVSTITQAAGLLDGRRDIQFKLIGDGQDASIVETHLRSCRSRMVWERSWQSSEQLAEEIARADICLGIFGDGDKTQRVCPLKIYAYAAVGRAIVTGETRWVREMTSDRVDRPFATIPVNDASALAATISSLADDAALRTKLAVNSRRFYETYLENRIALEKLSACLMES